MALINCTECAREISSEAESCPNCGHPVKHAITQKSLWPRIVLWASIAFVLLIIIPAIIGYSHKPTEAEKQECIKAIMSDMGDSTYDYKDKQAYDAYVEKKCQDFDIPK